MPAPHEASRSRKRPRPAPNPLPDDFGPATKRRKSLPKPESSCAHRPPSFWDTLSKVRLSRGALREFERRTSKSERQQQSHTAVSTHSSSTAITQAVKRFSRHGGPNLAHLRGFADSHPTKNAMSFSSSHGRKRSSMGSCTTSSTKTSKSSPYNGDFEQKLIDGGIYPEGYEYDDDRSPVEPTNLDDIHTALRVPRASLSPSQFSEAAFRRFKQQAARAVNEPGTMADLIPVIAGEGRKKHHSNVDVPFTNLTPIVEGVTAAKPDMYDGAPPGQVDPRVRHSLGHHIVPSKITSLPAVPNVFLEGKSAQGRADVARRQACHDGAVGARAMHSLQNYGAAEPRYDGNAYSYSSTYHDGQLKVYGTHPTKPKTAGGPPEYHMTQIRSFAMTDTSNSFRQGATAYRNLRDLGQKHRDSFIDQANEVARHAPSPSPTTANSRTSLSVMQEDDSDTSVDELATEELTSKRLRHVHPPSSRHEQPSPSHASRHRGDQAVQSRPRTRHTIKDSVTSSPTATATTHTAGQPTSRSRYTSHSAVTGSCPPSSTAHTSPHHGARSRHQIDDTATTRHEATSAAPASTHHSSRSRHTPSESAEEPRRRLVPAQKLAGGRHASDHRSRRGE